MHNLFEKRIACALCVCPTRQLCVHTKHKQFFNFCFFSEEAKLWFILKIENCGIIADICWCPLFSNTILEKIKKHDENILGYLAVTTDYGKVFIYKIEQTLPKVKSPSEPRILSCEPLWILKQPIATVKELASEAEFEFKQKSNLVKKSEGDETMDFTMENDGNSKEKKKAKKNEKAKRKRKKNSKNDENSEDEDEMIDLKNEEVFVEREIPSAPFLHLYWSPFNCGKNIVSVSATGWIFIWDLSKKEKIEDPSNWLYDDSWESLPTSAVLMNENCIVIGFPQNKIIYYNLETKDKIYEDNYQRSVGCFVTTEQLSFPGIFTYDIVKIIPEPNAVQYYSSSYQVLDLINDTGLTMQPLNR